MTMIHRRAPKLFGAKRKDDVVQMLLPSGRNKTGSFLGSGRFSNAFLTQQGIVYIYTLYGDMSKDILVDARKRLRSGNPHLPRIQHVGWIDGPKWADWDIRVYKSPWYNTHTYRSEMHHSAWYDRRELQVAHKDSYYDGIGYDFNRTVIEQSNVSFHVQEVLDTLVTVAADYGEEFIFDNFSRRNTAIDNKGKLVFIDPIFNSKVLTRDNRARR